MRSTSVPLSCLKPSTPSHASKARPNNIEIRHVLTVEWEPPFNEKSVDGFIKEYTDTIRFANLDQSDEAPADQPDQSQKGADSVKDVTDWLEIVKRKFVRAIPAKEPEQG
jgi:hypothetical protein